MVAYDVKQDKRPNTHEALNAASAKLARLQALLSQSRWDSGISVDETDLLRQVEEQDRKVSALRMEWYEQIWHEEDEEDQVVVRVEFDSHGMGWRTADEHDYRNPALVRGSFPGGRWGGVQVNLTVQEAADRGLLVDQGTDEDEGDEDEGDVAWVPLGDLVDVRHD